MLNKKKKIIFRAKAKNNTTGKWIYGYVIWDFTDKEYKIVDTGINNGFTAIESIDNATLSEHIGAVDKHGFEIYEGDILRDDMEELLIVKWVPERLSYRLFGRREHNKEDIYSGNFKFGNAIDSWLYPDNCIEIVGNIYDNMKLLGE